MLRYNNIVKGTVLHCRSNFLFGVTKLSVGFVLTNVTTCILNSVEVNGCFKVTGTDWWRAET